MDRPYGPRPAVRADQRDKAFESIFGRPSANHHQQQPGPSNPAPQQYQRAPPPQYPNYPPGNGTHPAQYAPQPAYRYPQQEPRAAYQAGYGPMQLAPDQTPRQAQFTVQPMQPYYPQPPPSAYRQNSLAPNMAQPNRAPSISEHGTPGVLAPQPEEAQDVVVDQLGRRVSGGMTPAQAYQQQVYINPSQARQNGWQPSHLVPGPNMQAQAALQRGVSINGAPARSSITTSGSTSDISEFGVSDRSSGYTTATSEGEFGNGDITPPTKSTSSLIYVQSQRGTPHSRRPSVNSVATSITDSTYTQAPYVPSTMDHYSGNSSPSPSTPQSPIDPALPGTPRRSSESARTLPHIGSRGQRQVYPNNERTRSFSSGHSIVGSGSHHPLPPIPSMSSIHPRSPRQLKPMRPPQVPAALLSRVAQAFRERVALSERVKDGLAYPDAFDGREAVDKLAYIIRTTDRNLALLFGRALDSQKFFHDVAYEHRLRDSAQELYQFQNRLQSPFVSKEEMSTPVEGVMSDTETLLPKRPVVRPASSGSSSQVSQAESAYTVTSPLSDVVNGGTVRPLSTAEPATPATDEDDIPLPTGVFTLLTDCYSPTCSRDSLCYSIACPRRLEQQSRLNMTPEAVLKKEDYEPETDLMEPGTLWIHSVPQEVIDKVSETEKKRQEAINEVMYTERDFVRDMEYLRDFWYKPLSTSDIIEESRRTDFLSQVFWNIQEIIAVNSKLRDALNKRQKGFAIVEKIGDILIDHVGNFQPFVTYGSHQLYGKYEFEKERSSNPAFSKFVDETERLPESRKLELNGYLTKPTTRLARYPLLLDVVLKYTPEDSPDKKVLPEVIAIIRKFLVEVNYETGKAENRFSLLQLDQQLVFRQGEQADLRLRDENRELVYKGALSRKHINAGAAAEDLQLFLFDHALLMVKAKSGNKNEQLRVYRKPIPLELLIIIADDDRPTKGNSTAARPKSSLIKGRSNSLGRNSPVPLTMPKGNALGYAITFVHLGRKGYNLTLYANTAIARKKWLENIYKRQEVLRDRSAIFDMVTLSESFFLGANKVNCACPFSGGNKVAYGTDDGVYISDIRVLTQDPVKVLAIPDVTQVDVLEEYQLLIVLSERTVMTFPLDALDYTDPMAGLRRAKRVASHTSFFKAGICLGRTFVCVVKASSLSSTIKVLEPIDQTVRGKNKPTFRKLLQGGNDTLKVFKEFYIPTESSSLHFLKTKLCVGCTKGFEIVDLETLDTQGLLDPADMSLDFVQKRENVKPIAIYRIDGEFLLCYDEFAFFVNKSGWRSKPHWIVYWEGIPSAFALHYPYVLAFEPTFIEVRHVDTGILVQIIPGNNLRCLFADTPPTIANHSHSLSYPPHRSPIPNQFNGQINPYGMQAPPGFDPYTMGGMAPATHTRQQQQNGRDEIILVSEDRVFCVKLANGVLPGQTYNMSQASLPIIPR
ncbi:CNH-domain-containing protein [Calocera viscosa TUFC12733]|uniref:CNH-domain-containing protein n=1 Tax=Calocera viscosa (strain TUFC12733) TaxID=1330018 RepID=A0A167S656_CALVF|nr:CNH-domain-containing protein [Calocera viscosa TUFC12733]